MNSFTKKDFIWLLGIVASLSVTWGMWSERLNAVEKKADAVAQKETQVTRTIGDKTMSYQPEWWKNSVVVSE